MKSETTVIGATGPRVELDRYDGMSDDDPSDGLKASPNNGARKADPRGGRGVVRSSLVGLLALLVVVSGGSVGYLCWKHVRSAAVDRARMESAQAAKDATIALLSYEPGTAEQKLSAAKDRLTGDFRDSYTSLTHDVVVPAAVQRRISAVADVPAVAVLSADPRHAVAMVFVDQTTIVGGEAPTATSSVVKVTLDRVDDRWLISGFEPM
ncbi:hypothetical protein BA059_20675 [Mycolicibacterium sp. (ex Dasyatis americana)]|nr:hypothetical protein BA059_20675 [Mycolicibacterium sp. (ex Dasyatis americana)]